MRREELTKTKTMLVKAIRMSKLAHCITNSLSKLLILPLMLSCGVLLSSCATNDSERAVSSGNSNSLGKDLRNFHKVNDYLYRGGMPTPDGIQALHDNGINTIVDLRCDDLGIKLEKHVATTLGMEHISLPSGNAPPHPLKLAKFISAVNEMEKAHKSGKPGAIYVHCNAGCDRTSFYIAVWRVVEQGWQPLLAYVEMLRYGFLIHHLDFPVTSEADTWVKPSRPYDQYNPKR